MKNIGFLISTKENERRRALLPRHVLKVKNKRNLYFESSYGDALGHTDKEYLEAGANVVSKLEALGMDIICDPKIGDADYLADIGKGKTVFGWVHAVQNRSITDTLINNQLTAIAWEDMFEEGRHVFWRNNEIAGEAAIMHAFTLYGKFANQCKVALLGRGNVARGAYKMLSCLGATVRVYDRKSEALLAKELDEFDVIVNGVLWDIRRRDHIIYRDHLSRLRQPAMIVDISCDKNGAIETSVPTSIQQPVYYIDGVLHYVVDHTPALFAYSTTDSLGDLLVKYLDKIIEGVVNEDNTLAAAVIINAGKIIDQRIIDYQQRVV